MIEFERGRASHVATASSHRRRATLPSRWSQLADGLERDRGAPPDEAAVEETFVNRNADST